MTKSSKSQFGANTGYLPDGGKCAATGKLIWFSRSDAKKALRKFKGRGAALKGRHVYACTQVSEGESPHFHFGRPPQKLRRGQIARDDVYQSPKQPGGSER